MSELIDRQALRAAHGLGSDCHDCKRDMKSCQYDRDYSLMDFCEWLDDAPTASPWHRVEEPPKEHMWCFVYTDEPDMIMPIRIAFYVASCTGKGSWYHYESGEDIDDEVDYWTPMYLEGPDVDKGLSWPIEPPKEDA